MQYGLSIAFCDPAEYIPLARAAEERGFSWVSLSDHLFYPQTMSAPYPYTPDGKAHFDENDFFPEPWTAITAMAQHTTALRFYTNIFILPARNAIHVAKALAAASVFSGGRIALGVGMGWMPEEFSASGHPFKQRGKHADEMLIVMKKLWSGEWAEHHGEFYDFDPVRMLPKPTAPIPIYVGGLSDAAFKRAARHDGWISDLHTIADLNIIINKIYALREEYSLPKAGYKISCFNPLDAHTREQHAQLEAMGVTTITTMPWATQAYNDTISLADKIKAMDDYANAFIA